MVENLADYEPSGKKRTTKTNSLTQGQALEILQQAVLNYQSTGAKIYVKPDDECYHATLIILPGVTVADGKLEVTE